LTLASFKDRRPVVAVVAGSGQVAHTAAGAGADLLLVLNAGLYRTLGYGSLASFLPFGNANNQTLHLLRDHVLPRAGPTPVVAGVFGADPTLDLDNHLERLRALGVCGVTNWPSLGFVDGQFREALEAEGFDPASELRTLTVARRHGLAAVGFAHTEEDAGRFAAVCDGLVLNVGLTHRVDDRQDRRDRVQAAIARLNRMLAVVESANRRPLCLMFGGPVTTAEDLQAVLRQSGIDGIAGGSVFERLPVERAVTSIVRQFKAVPVGSPDPGESRLGPLVGQSPAMRQLFDTVRRVARYDVNVCIEGATGTGKELIAAEIHRLSPRSHEPFVTLNCGAIPDTLLESELFGHEKGAFTGADRRRPGKFELADGGTLFLDEVADLSPRAQVALLRAIQQGEIVRVGGDRPVHVSVRIITATHQHLPQCVADGRFRSDLYYRLNQVSLRVPALAERREDIPLLIAEILARLRTRFGREIAGVTPEFERRLLAHDWPGNVRELEHVLGRAAILEDGAELDGSSFQPEGFSPPPKDDSRLDQRRQAEEAVRRAAGNKSRAAALLGVSRKTLYAWLKGQ
jgi:transcriptional regulator with AAA-type ATPase domain/predicted TIM-barrel enzyme